MKRNNLIVINGGDYDKIKKALNQWIDLYSKDLQNGLTFELYRNGTEKHIIQVDERMDNERFYYLINYLKYPEEIEYEIDIEGFTTGKDRNKLKNKDLLVYISPKDQDYDNVFITTSDHENFKMDFGGKIKDGNESKIYSFPTNLNLGLSESITVQNKQKKAQHTAISTDNLEKRFKVIISIIVSLYFLTFLFYQKESNFLNLNYTMTSAVWFWLILDFKILQVNKLYFSAVALGLGLFIYGLFLDANFEQKVPIILPLSTMPIFLLIIQRPLRFAFIKLIKREPEVENRPTSIPDLIYSLFLWMTISIIPLFILLMK
jgi:hypothetical protein